MVINSAIMIRCVISNGIIDNMLNLLYDSPQYSQWSKVTNFEHATRIPFMIKYPGAKPGRYSSFFEAVDLLPTMVDMAFNLSIPSCPKDVPSARKIELCTDGASVAPGLRGDEKFEPKTAAYSQVPRGAIIDGEPGNIPGEIYMGYTLRTEGYRYSEWVGFNASLGKGNWSNLVGRELYVHNSTALSKGSMPGCDWNMETHNVVNMEEYKSISSQLSQQLRNQFFINWTLH
eukprot:m.129677 g.129677  ORF g.129677 m.129677 type:complete len:231 (-) comp14583_c0_seq2:56-748(-)